MVFHHRNQAAPDRDAGAVQRVQEAHGFAIRSAEAGVHPAGLEVPGVGAGGDFPPRLLPGQPHFQIEGAGGAEAGIAGGELDPAIGQAEQRQHFFGAGGHAFLLGHRLIGMDDGDHFHLLELMLAQHAAGVASGGAGFAAEAVGQRGHADRQAGFRHDGIAHRVGQRDFRGGDQPAAIGGTEAVFGEFRQLAGAEHGGVVHQHRHGGFLVAMLLGVQIEHELAERAFHPRQPAAQNGEAGAGDFAGQFEVHHSQAFAQLKMLERGKGEFHGLPDLVHDDVGALIGAIRHVFIKAVG